MPVYKEAFQTLVEKDRAFFSQYEPNPPQRQQRTLPKTILKNAIKEIPSTSESDSETAMSEDDVPINNVTSPAPPARQEAENAPSTPNPNSGVKGLLLSLIASLTALVEKQEEPSEGSIIEHIEPVLRQILDSKDKKKNQQHIKQQVPTYPKVGRNESFEESLKRFRKETQDENSNNNPWVTVTRGRYNAPPHSRPQKTPFTKAQQERVLQGLPPHEVGFATVELHNIHRIPLREVRRTLVGLGIENRWIRDMITVGPRKMELIVFKEKVDDIKRLLSPTKLRLETDTIHTNLFTASLEDLEHTKTRLERQAERLHSKMVMVKRFLADLHSEVVTELEARKSGVTADDN
jgi:hypothetical protein